MDQIILFLTDHYKNVISFLMFLAVLTTLLFVELDSKDAVSKIKYVFIMLALFALGGVVNILISK